MSDNSPFADVKVPFPDAAYATRTSNRLVTALTPGTGLGGYTPAVSWAGRVRGTETPVPFESVTGLFARGRHWGGFAAGEDEPSYALLESLAGHADVSLRYLDTVDGAAAEDGEVLNEADYIEALEAGRQAADSAVDSGADLLVLGGLGPGTRAAAIAVTSHLTRTPVTELSPRLRVSGGFIDDNAWMRHTAAIRDTFARLGGPGRQAETMLREIGGPVMATLVGAMVAAAIRRTPMLFDGPVTAAAALVSRDFSLGAPKWSYAPDRIPHPVVDKIAGQIGMAEAFGRGVDLGEGVAVLHALPSLQQMLRTVTDLPFPEPEAEEEDEEENTESSAT